MLTISRYKLRRREGVGGEGVKGKEERGGEGSAGADGAVSVGLSWSACGLDPPFEGGEDFRAGLGDEDRLLGAGADAAAGPL
jgi:hypothetical protein